MNSAPQPALADNASAKPTVRATQRARLCRVLANRAIACRAAERRLS
jgi:hypothetical protein